MSKTSNKFGLLTRQPLWRLGVIGAVIVAGGVYFATRKAAPTNGTSFAARRGPLQISVLEGGSVEAIESQEIRSQIKGYQGTKILTIVEEGYLVSEDDIKNGKVLVELDSSELKQKITTEEIQFQSTLSSLIEAQQAYDIQYNQNKSDLKAAEQKAQFAFMDLEKYLGEKVTKEITERLDLKMPAFTNDYEISDADLEPVLPDLTPASNFQRPAGMPPGMGAMPPNMQGMGDPGPPPNAMAGQPGARRADAQNRPRREGEGSAAAPEGMRQRPQRRPDTNAVDLQSIPGGLMASAPALTNILNKKPSKPVSTNEIQIDYSKYADTNKLADGAAKQALRKLMDDLLIARQDLALSMTHLEGSKRLFEKEFITKNEFDNESLTVDKNVLKVQTSQTAYDLFIRYEFSRTSQDYVSKYDEALRSLSRARKEAVSKQAQARARLKSAEGRYRIEMEQRAELFEQMTNCVIRAKRPGLVVYGGSGDDRRFGNEEPIREGATVRERQSIITIPDMTQMSLKVKIHESQIKKVVKGQKARVQVDAFPDQKLMGEVTKVSVLPDSGNRWMNPDMKVYATVIAIEGSREWLKPGMSAKVEVLVKELTDVIYIPIQAVVPIKGKQYCFIANGGAPEQRAVEVGDFNEEFIEIKSGLKAGEKVLLRTPPGVETDQIETGDRMSEDAPPAAVAKPSAQKAAQPGAPSAQPARNRESQGGGGQRQRSGGQPQ
jgi:multidrug resistance efflux pump